MTGITDHSMPHYIRYFCFELIVCFIQTSKETVKNEKRDELFLFFLKF